MTICWWVFGIRRSSIRLWKAEPLLYKNSPTKSLKLDVDGNEIVLKTRDFHMTMSVQMHFIGCPTVSICQVVLKLRPKTNSLRWKTSLLWIHNEKVLPNASSACLLDLDTSGSAKSLSYMQTLNIFGSIIWFVVICTQFHFVMLQNKMFESWIATEVL